MREHVQLAYASTVYGAQTTDLTRVCVATLRWMRHQGTGPRSFRLGRRVMYRLSDVLAWIAQHYHDDDPQAA